MRNGKLQFCLCKAVLHHLFVHFSSHGDPRFLYKRVMAVFAVHLVEQQVNLLSPETASPERLRVAMEMLKKAAGKVGKLYRENLDLPDMLSPLQSLRGALDCLLRVRGEQKASQCRLDITSFAAVDFFYPFLDEEELESESSAGPNTALAIKRAEKNLKDVLTPS